MKHVLIALLLFSTVAAAAKSVDVAAGKAKIATAKDAPPEAVLDAAAKAWSCAKKRGEVSKPVVTVIDYSLPSTEKRLWVLDFAKGEVVWNELVAHGKGTGENEAVNFSNKEGTHASSLGAFATLGTYTGENGYSMKLKGLERGVNDAAEERAIVMHGAWYVDDALAKKQGRIGRSWGCPAVRDEISQELIDRIKGGSLVLAYHPDEAWAKSSRYLGECK
jgi:hypothetical protein